MRLSLQAKNIKSTRQVTSKERIELLFRRIRTILKWKVSSYESEKLETGFPLAKKCESGDVVCFSAGWLPGISKYVKFQWNSPLVNLLKKRSQIFFMTFACRIDKNGLNI